MNTELPTTAGLIAKDRRHAERERATRWQKARTEAAIPVVAAWLDNDEELRVPDTQWGSDLYDALNVVLSAAQEHINTCQPKETR